MRLLETGKRGVVVCVAAVGLVWYVGAQHAAAEVLYESAADTHDMPFFGGTLVAERQYLGQRFEVESAVTMRSVGASLFVTHYNELGNGYVFAAVVGLSGPDDVPDSFDLSTADVLGVTLLPLPTQLLSLLPQGGKFYGDRSANLTLALDPGWYSVVLGSGRFGATGDAGATFLPLADPSSPFGMNPDRLSLGWYPSGFAGFNYTPATHRFFVDTEPVGSSVTAPEAATGAMVVLWLVGMAGVRSRGENGWPSG